MRTSELDNKSIKNNQSINNLQTKIDYYWRLKYL